MSKPFPSRDRGLPFKDRRGRPRLGFDCPVRWNRGGVDRCGWAKDISEIGAGFTVRPLSAPKVGEEIQLVFELDSQRRWVVDERALVERCEKRNDQLYDIGVRLNLIDVD